MDINADGHKDILVGSFSGSPYLIQGGEEGFGEPEPIMDSSDQAVLISKFWNKEDKKWDETDRAESEGHCTSASAVDWDDDGDLDLILGDYYGGRLYLRLNEGTATEPSFAETNSPVNADGEPIVIKKGLAAPHIVDWDGDGLFDVLCGGSKGGVFLFKNTGKKGAPELAAAETLIEPLNDDSFIKKVPAFHGQPTQPGSSFHLEATDYDGDGDLDLLVGARCSWEKDNVKDLSVEDQKRLEDIDQEISELRAKIKELVSAAKTEEQREELVKSDAYKELVQENVKLFKEKRAFNFEPTDSGDFVWLFRRK